MEQPAVYSPNVLEITVDGQGHWHTVTMSKHTTETGSSGKGLEKLFCRWDRKSKVEETDLGEIPYLPPVCAPAQIQSFPVVDREIRLLALLCVSVALLCLNWATMGSRLDSSWQSGKGSVESSRVHRSIR